MGNKAEQHVLIAQAEKLRDLQAEMVVADREYLEALQEAGTSPLHNPDTICASTWPYVAPIAYLRPSSQSSHGNIS